MAQFNLVVEVVIDRINTARVILTNGLEIDNISEFCLADHSFEQVVDQIVEPLDNAPVDVLVSWRGDVFDRGELTLSEAIEHLYREKFSRIVD